jgi:uncharacterized secreted protein with C-terminal beta-propeller domain
MTMNKKIAAVLLAATMLTTPVFAASVATSPNTPTAQTVNDKVTKTSDKDVKKHRVHARSSHGHKIYHARHAKQNQVKHTHKSSKKGVASAGTKSHTKKVAAAPAKAQPKN